MKNSLKITLTSLLLFSASLLFAQQKLGDNLGTHKAEQNLNMNTKQVLNTSGILIGSVAPITNSNIALQIVSPNKAIVISTVAVNTDIATPVEGMIIFSSTDNTLYVYNTGIWQAVPSREMLLLFNAAAGQTVFTLNKTPSSNSRVKMFINGILLSHGAYTISGTTITYLEAVNNGNYVIQSGDRIQFDFFY